jgi:hypothetical protein
MSDQLAATMAVMGQQVPEVVVSCSYAYANDAGETRTWRGDGLASELQGMAQYDPSGQWIRGGLSLTLKVSDLHPRWPQEGDIIDVRRGNSPAVVYAVKSTRPMLRTLLVLILEQKYK